MVNYSDGKIYKIEPIQDHDEGDVYFGSTTKPLLCQRFATHKTEYKRFKENKTQFVTSFDLFDKYGFENCQIILLELVNATSKDELIAREAYFIRNFKCINKIIPDRTRSEYLKTDTIIESMKEKRTEYYNSNKAEICEQKMEHYYKNKEEIIEKRKEHYYKNQDKILEKLKQKFDCDCGGKYTRGGKLTHERSAKHQHYLTKL
jgi:hypothetical protein